MRRCRVTVVGEHSRRLAEHGKDWEETTRQTRKSREAGAEERVGQAPLEECHSEHREGVLALALPEFMAMGTSEVTFTFLISMSSFVAKCKCSLRRVEAGARL